MTMSRSRPPTPWAGTACDLSRQHGVHQDELSREARHPVAEMRVLDSTQRRRLALPPELSATSAQRCVTGRVEVVGQAGLGPGPRCVALQTCWADGPRVDHMCSSDKTMVECRIYKFVDIRTGFAVEWSGRAVPQYAFTVGDELAQVCRDPLGGCSSTVQPTQEVSFVRAVRHHVPPSMRRLDINHWLKIYAACDRVHHQVPYASVKKGDCAQWPRK